jgi:6-phosphogluconate dehydrogenase
MQIGLVGLGKMGFNLALNLHRNGFEVIANDVNPDFVTQIAQQGISTASSLEDLTTQLTGRRVIWLMVPAGEIVDAVIEQLIPLLNPSDIIIDGGNSFSKILYVVTHI